MIINISGTSGSGKSILVRLIMDRAEKIDPFFVEDRKRPVGYTCTFPNIKPLWIMGHYETACGGCDTLASFKPTLDFIYEVIKKKHDQGFHVLYEGMLIKSDVRRTVELYTQGYPIKIIHLDLSLEFCLEGVNIRRRRKNPRAKNVDPKNIIAIHNQNVRRCERLEEAGVSVYRLNREEAYLKCKELLGL